MAERLKAAVLKTVMPKGIVGSNPTSSARIERRLFQMIRPAFVRGFFLEACKERKERMCV